MIRQGISFEEIYDKFAVRIIYKSKPEKGKIHCMENLFNSN